MHDQQLNDYELLYLIYQRDDESLELLIQKYEKIMYIFYQTQITLMFHIRGNVDEYQIGRLVLLKAIENFRVDKNVTFRHYFLFLLKNEMRNLARKNKLYLQKRAVSVEYLLHENSEPYLEDMWKDKNATMQADWLIRREEILSRILKMEHSLNDTERRILRLRLYGYTYHEISKVLGVSRKKVDNTLYKVRNRKV